MSLNDNSDFPEQPPNPNQKALFGSGRVVVIIPTYNEIDNLPLLAAELWAQNIPNLIILIVDDNSPDGTGDIADDLAARRVNDFFVIHQKGRSGLGPAYITGFKWALEKDADFVIQMDCDFSHSPRYIQQMLEMAKNADVVIGSRYVEGGKLDEHWGSGRYLLSWWANSVYIRFILNMRVKDSTTGFKCWRVDALRGIELGAVNSNGYSFQFEMAYLAEKLGYRVVEVPIYFEDRRIGESRLTLPHKIEAALRVWEIRWRYRNFTPSEHLLVSGSGRKGARES